MTIRLARTVDVEPILAISNWAAINTPANFAVEPEKLDTWMATFEAESDSYPWFVAVDDEGTVLGFAKGSPWKGRCAYAYSAETTVYVHPDHHRKGIGAMLYGVLLPTMQAQGFRSLMGGITLPNDASVALHERMGYRQVARFERVGWKFGRWHDVGYWQITFDGAAPERLLSVAEAVGA